MIQVRATSRLVGVVAALAVASTAPAQELPVSREGLTGALAQYAAGADSDGDGKLARREVATALGRPDAAAAAPRDSEPFRIEAAPDGRQRLVLNEHGPLGPAGMIDIGFRLADSDGDGLLSVAEIQTAGGAAFDLADRDGDGLLDEAERRDATEKLALFGDVLASVK